MFVQQLAECVVDMVVNRDMNLFTLISRWNGSFHLLAFVLLRASLHPTCVEFGKKIDSECPLSVTCYTGSDKDIHRKATGLALYMQADAKMLVRCGFESSVVTAVVRIWESKRLENSEGISPATWFLVLVFAIDVVSSLMKLEDILDGKLNGLADMAALN